MLEGQTFAELIIEAQDMLLDRPQIERDLIYYVAKLNDEERQAIKFAYQNIKDSDDYKNSR